MTKYLLDAAIEVASRAHSGQRRKYTDHPYLTHCLEVVNILIDYDVHDQKLLAAAMLHDVVEDCEGWDAPTLLWNLCNASKCSFMPKVVDLVIELTEPDHQGNRATRKALECERLSKISNDAQTIKYADLISNTSSITRFDPNFAKVYLQEKWSILKVMRSGNIGLLNMAEIVCQQRAYEIELDLAP